MATFQERVYWHQHSYGKALRVSRRNLIAAFVIGCIVTPFTNWLIPFAPKIIREDMVLRY